MKSIKKFRNVVFRNIFRGNKYYCIYCGNHANRFLSAGSHSPRVQELDAVGIARRKNAVCPFCGSSDRSRLLRIYLQKQMAEFAGSSIKLLHIAPDDILARWLRLQPGIDFTCGSLYPEDFAEFNAVKLDVAAIDFPDNSFDVILCNHVLQQVPDHLAAMREISRVLVPGGWALIQVPIARKLAATDEDLTLSDPHEKRRRFGSTLHCRIYGNDYSQLLQDNGDWNVQEIKINEFLSPEEIEKNALISNEVIFRAAKTKD